MVKNFKRWISPVAITLLAITAFQAQGAERTWVGGGGSGATDWSNSENWSPSTTPSNADLAVFVGSATYQPTVNSKLGVQGLVFQSSGWNIGMSGAFSSLQTWSEGVHNAATSGTNTVGATISAMGTQTWTVDAGGTFVTTGTVYGSTITKAGGGTLALASTSVYTGAMTVSGGTLRVNGRITGADGVQVQSGATLGGSGSVTKISGAGTVKPGNSPGILTATSVDGTLGTDFTFEFTRTALSGTSAPIFSDAAASGNDLLRLTNATPFTVALNANNVITVDFTGVTLTIGDIYQGGFYADSDFLSSINSATFNYVGVGAEFNILLSTSQVFADFSGGDANGYITQFTVIPEPGATALVALSLGGLWLAARRRKGEKTIG